ncbi:MAG: DUF4198 domain-containing protein [Pseudomonadota bacterium]
MRCLALFILAFAGPAAAHEFWISPPDYQVPVGTPATADIRVGESFKGNRVSYLTRQTARFDVVQNGQIIDPEATLGDRPVLDKVLPEGLAIVVYETIDSRLTYNDFEKFMGFVDHKAFSGFPERHDARGLPREGFVETYRRFAKSLIAVGDGAGSDVRVGLDTEIVALANPYTDDTSGGLPVQVLLRGEPRVGAQVEVYAKAPDDTVFVRLYETDAQGMTTITVAPGYEFMVDAVTLEEGEGEAAWHSMWANLTFEVPG